MGPPGGGHPDGGASCGTLRPSPGATRAPCGDRSWRAMQDFPDAPSPTPARGEAPARVTRRPRPGRPSGGVRHAERERQLVQQRSLGHDGLPDHHGVKLATSTDTAPGRGSRRGGGTRAAPSPSALTSTRSRPATTGTDHKGYDVDVDAVGGQQHELQDPPASRQAAGGARAGRRRRAAATCGRGRRAGGRGIHRSARSDTGPRLHPGQAGSITGTTGSASPRLQRVAEHAAGQRTRQPRRC